MGKPTGFIEIARQKQPTRPVEERLRDWREVYLPADAQMLREQASRCMDCGIPFCHQGCPLGNLIPTWNDFVYRDRWRPAIDRLHATNNFPEFTGRLCPAPCEASCVLGINDAPVTIKATEVAIVDRAFAEAGLRRGRPPDGRRARRGGWVRSAGLAASDQLNRAGHTVTVFERADRAGGLLRYGIPAFKLSRNGSSTGGSLMVAEGVVFRPRCNVGIDGSPTIFSRTRRLVLAGGAASRATCESRGAISTASISRWNTSTAQNRRSEGDRLSADDTSPPKASRSSSSAAVIQEPTAWAPCCVRGRRRSASSRSCRARPTRARVGQPVAGGPQIFRVSTAHEEGGERLFSVSTEAFLGDDRGRVHALRAVRVDRVAVKGRTMFQPVAGTEFELPADLVLLAMGFTGPERGGVLEQLGVRMTDRGTVWRDDSWMTNVPGVFAAGDMQRGQSLIVWAIADGRSCARGVDTYLMGESDLPAPF